MNKNINLFLKNNTALKSIKGSWKLYNVQKKLGALNVTLRNDEIDTEKINSAIMLIKKHTSIISNFRGANILTTAILISLEDDMENSLKEIISIYDRLKQEFSISEYLIIAAQIIFSSRNIMNIDDAIKNTKTAYKYMKKNHRFLTGSEDIASAALIATTSINLEKTFKDIEECYTLLKSKSNSSRNNIQALSHILSLVNLPSENKCRKVLDMQSALKENNIPLKSYYLPVLGIVSFLTNNISEFAEKAANITQDLKSCNGFGTFSIDSQLRNMISVSLASMDYLNNLDDDLKLHLINSTSNMTLTVVSAIETSIIAASCAATAAASASSSS